jgi:hypothetical protein
MWVTIAINMSTTYDPSYSYVWTADGDVVKSGGIMTIHGGGGNGTAPSGVLPSAVSSCSPPI